MSISPTLNLCQQALDQTLLATSRISYQMAKLNQGTSLQATAAAPDQLLANALIQSDRAQALVRGINQQLSLFHLALQENNR